ncbi:MAG: hypothetical protein FWJ70_16865 [Micromonosporaceae bacterium]|jgi:hypothetical protein
MATPNPGASPAEPAGTGASIPVRPLTAWALLALAAVAVLFAFLSWIFPSGPISFVNRVSVSQFASVTVLVPPLLAMLVATKLGTPLPQAKTMGLVALATYGVAVLFAFLAFLLTIADKFDDLEGRGGLYGFGRLLEGIGALVTELLLVGLLGLAALWTYKLFTGLGGRLPAVNVQTD